MPDYKLRINGLRHHDFKDRLDELYELAPRHRMSISIEHDNVAEQDAVIVYWGKHFVGYVRSGEDRELALSLIQASGRATMLGRIVGFDRGNRWLWMEISSQQEPTPTKNRPSTILTGWHFEGKTLRLDEDEERLHTMLCNLEMTLEQQEPWDEDMEQWLEYCEGNLWLEPGGLGARDPNIGIANRWQQCPNSIQGSRQPTPKGCRQDGKPRNEKETGRANHQEGSFLRHERAPAALWQHG